MKTPPDFHLTIEEFMKINKPYLKAGYSLADLAGDLNSRMHIVSAFINQHYKIPLNDFLNNYRVDYCIEKFSAGEHETKKLEAIALEAGFGNRNTFISAFVKKTGFTPSKFIKQQTIC